MSTDLSYIEVAVALPVHHTFTYSAPESFQASVAVGKRVLVPFGRRRVTGYIFDQNRHIADKEIKPVLDVLDEHPLFPSSMVPFFRWIADYYKYPIGEVVKNALPGGLNVHEAALISLTDKGRHALNHIQLTPIAIKILKQLNTAPCRWKEITTIVGQTTPRALLYNFEQNGWIKRTWELKGASTKARLERVVRLADTVQPDAHLSTPRQKILAILKSEGEVPVKILKETVATAPALIKKLESAGYVIIDYKRVFRDPLGESIQPDQAPVLNREQDQVVSYLCDNLNQGYKPFLLNGVTGSGKTEVYMRVADELLKQGRRVLILVPEIALITQMERRFRARFGECVCVLHSALSAGERYDQWTRILQGEATIGIGARSAIFAPFDNLGVIIVDEEHDSSYKQEGLLRYNARDLAVVRAKQNECVVLLGSATPSIQSYYNVVTQKFTELILEKRVEKRPLPEIQIVDLRQIRDARGIHRFLGPELQLAIKETLEREEQVLLFLNRRGYASFPVCGACGQPMRCKHCDISLTLHQRTNAYRCHYCGYSRAAIATCDTCGSSKIKHLGLGTERLEDILSSLFRPARVARMDRDTTTRKGSILKLLKGLKNKNIDILVGTQMVAKGHDFPGITLVGIICADLSLNFPDFRAGERTFQLLAQVAGRAGRGDRPGKVILQTYNPENFCISAARNQDFKSFYQQEITFRQALNYPPFARMIQLKISGKLPQETANHARLLGDLCRTLKQTNPGQYQSVEIMGPIEAYLTRIAGRYRWQILLKGSNSRALHQFINQLMSERPAGFARRQVQVAIDVDPVFLM
ncbi:MAG: primosomal protein N' [Desulfobacterales bacterium]|nr:MAG: primosomal protein N' [Desulfobacterales bacterium]